MTMIGTPTMTATKEFVFVYGTLKTGQAANYKMPSSGFIGNFVSDSLFRVFGEGFPMAILSTSGHPLLGEVYLCDRQTMATLDAYEGYPQFYTRDKLIFSNIEDGTKVAAWVYHIDNPEGYYRHPLAPNDEGILDWTRG